MKGKSIKAVLQIGPVLYYYPGVPARVVTSLKNNTGIWLHLWIQTGSGFAAFSCVRLFVSSYDDVLNAAQKLGESNEF